MNCQAAHRLFDDLLDAGLQPAAIQSLHRHLAACGACRQALDAEREFRRQLRALPVPAPSPGFAARALRRATAPRPAHGHRGFLAGALGGALAAGLVLWLGAVWLRPAAMVNDLGGVALVRHEIRVVHLVVDAPQALADAQLRMRLPPGVQLAGFGEQRDIAWTTVLAPGANLLSLPLTAGDARGGELIAEISHGDGIKTYRLRLTVEVPAGPPPQSQTHSGLA